MNQFNELVHDQFSYGGKKYALDNEKESTDVLFEKHGKNWLFGTMDKYTFRFRNLERERDLLKIATYCYITWLKRGFWVKQDGLIDVLDTTVEVKSIQFSKFINKLNLFLTENTVEKLEDYSSPLLCISENLYYCSNHKWTDISEDILFEIYFLCFLIWFEKYSQSKTHDTDTHNESKLQCVQNITKKI